jgi:hypothetical protein
MRDQGKKTKVSRYRDRINKAYEDARAQAVNTGNMRVWFVPVLVETLKVYWKLRKRKSKGRRLSSCLGSTPREVFGELLKDIGRDRKTRNRWAAALTAAVDASIKSSELASWLRMGGGVSRRARRPDVERLTADEADDE